MLCTVYSTEVVGKCRYLWRSPPKNQFCRYRHFPLKDPKSNFAIKREREKAISRCPRVCCECVFMNVQANVWANAECRYRHFPSIKSSLNSPIGLFDRFIGLVKLYLVEEKTFLHWTKCMCAHSRYRRFCSDSLIRFF